MNGFSIFFVALTVLNAFRFRRTKDRWYLALCLLFGSMLVRERLPEVVFNLLLVGLIAWTVWLGAFKFIPSLRLRRLLANPSLKPLTDEERKWRAALEDWERDQIESYESVAGARLSRQQAEEILESVRKTRMERAAYLAEVAAEEEKERAAEAERKELEVSAVSSPLMATDSTGRETHWLMLQGLDDPDDEDGGIVHCAVWPREPKANEAGHTSYLSLPAVIDFPASAFCANPVFWTSTSPEFKAMFKSRCLIADVGMMDDGRDRFEFRIGDQTFVIMTKYLSWQTALALDSNQQRVWVRIAGMSSELWGEADDEHGNPQPKFLDFERIPAFVYPVPVDRLMPTTNPEAHFASMEERYE